MGRGPALPPRRLRPHPPRSRPGAHVRGDDVPLRHRRDRGSPRAHRAAAGGRHVRLGGGAATVRQYLRAGLLDELHVAVVPVLLGSGERLFGDLGDALDGWTCVEFTPSDAVAHVRLRRG
ncbi:MAG TPA: dihydrofolate reductase family protein [Blastococcus sp.]|nr:dihydrofolate reductase family protein [Blastococcus sp.]